MGNIYTQKVTSDLYSPIESEKTMANTVSNFGKQWEAQAEARAEKAKQTYKNYLDGDVDTAMQQMYMANPNNPEKLSEDIDNASSKIFQNIDDQDVKLAVMTDAMLKKNNYIVKSVNNQMKLQRRQNKISSTSTIVNNINGIGEMVEGVMFGEGKTQDGKSLVAGIMQSYLDNETKLHDVDEDGFPLYTDGQIIQYRGMFEKAKLNAAKRGLKKFVVDNPYKARQHILDVQEDKAMIFTGSDEEGNPVYKNLMELMDYDTYDQYKEFALGVHSRSKSLSSALGPSADPAEVNNIASEQTWNEQEMASALKEIKTFATTKTNSDGESGYKYADKAKTIELSVLDLRAKLQDLIEQGKISEKFFVDNMAETVTLMTDRLKLDRNMDDIYNDESLFSPSTALQGAKNYIGKELSQLEPQYQMFLLDTIYTQLNEEGLLDTPYMKNSSIQARINRIADNAMKTFLNNQIPGLPDTKASRVLYNGRFFNYITNPNPVYDKQVYDRTRHLFVKDGIKYYNFTSPSGITYKKRIIDDQ